MKSASIKIIVTIAIFVIINAAILIFGIIPATTRLQTNQGDLANIASDLEAAQTKYENLMELKKNEAETAKIQDIVMGYLPDDKTSSDFVVKIEAMAKDLSLIVPTLSITEPAPVKAKKSSDEDDSSDSTSKSKSTSTSTSSKQQTATQNTVDFTLTFSASYNTAQSFISRLMAFPRFCSLDSIAFTNYSSESDTLSVRIVGKIYYGK